MDSTDMSECRNINEVDSHLSGSTIQENLVCVVCYTVISELYCMYVWHFTSILSSFSIQRSCDPLEVTVRFHIDKQPSVKGTGHGMKFLLQ